MKQTFARPFPFKSQWALKKEFLVLLRSFFCSSKETFPSKGDKNLIKLELRVVRGVWVYSAKLFVLVFRCYQCKSSSRDKVVAVFMAFSVARSNGILGLFSSYAKLRTVFFDVRKYFLIIFQFFYCFSRLVCGDVPHRATNKRAEGGGGRKCLLEWKCSTFWQI